MGSTDESVAQQHQGVGEWKRPQAFVGRDDILNPVRESLEKGAPPFHLHVVGTWGIGKSSLLEKIKAQAGDKPIVFGPIQASLYAEWLVGWHAQSEAPTDIGFEARYREANFEQYTRLLESMITESETKESGLQVLRALIKEARNKVSLHGAPTSNPKMDTAGKLHEVRDGPPSDYPMGHVIDEWVARLRAEFQKELETIAGGPGAIVLIDELGRLRDHKLLHRWLVELVIGLTRPIVIVASREEEDFNGPLNVKQLDLFTYEEVKAYLDKLLESDVAPELVTRVLDFSRGLPQAVAMAAELIARRRVSGGQEDLGDVLSDDSTPETVTTELLGAIVAEMPSEDERLLVREGRLARRIDEDVAHYLLFRKLWTDGSVEQHEKDRTSNAWSDLKNYSFVEEVGTDPNDLLGRWRFHTYLRRATAPPKDSSLNVNEQLVHEKLAEYYQRLLHAYNEQRADDSVYMSWYKYEQQPWQALMLEWLYHAGQLEHREERVAARLEFARVFLELFWWWGCYVDYPFCKKVLDLWDRTQQPNQREASRLMLEIYEAYPGGYTKQDPEGWLKVREALQDLRDDLRVNDNDHVPTQTTADAGVQLKRAQTWWYVRAFTSLFLAHSFRYRPGEAELAIRYYEDSLKDLKATEDTTTQAWTTFELADLWSELRDLKQARARLAEAARLIEEEEDLELLANLHRLHGDLLQAGVDRWEAVLSATGRALVRAYAYLNWPNPPDDYTVAFYGEMRERAARRLIDMHRSQSADTAAGRRAVESFAAQLAELHPVDTAAVEQILVGITSVDEEADVMGKLQKALAPPPPLKLGREARDDPDFHISTRRAMEHVKSDSDADHALSDPSEEA